jgi:hypothetical protein
MLERRYQAGFIKKLRARFPGCIIIKNDPNYLQGLPDLTILYGDKWAALEVKGDADAPVQPNQQYYVDRLNRMSYAAFVFPGNEEDVLRELEHAFESSRDTRVPIR